MTILLINPHKRVFPIALHRFEKFFKDKGHEVFWHSYFEKKVDLIIISCLCTWQWYDVEKKMQEIRLFYPDARVWIGGIYPILLPEHARKLQNENVKIWEGNFPFSVDIQDKLVLDGVQHVKASIGCPKKCDFCDSWRVEPKFILKKNYSIISERIFIWDYNFLGHPEALDILKKTNRVVNIIQGVDASKLTKELADEIVRTYDSSFTLKMAWDIVPQGKYVRRSLDFINGRIDSFRIKIFMMYNWKEDFDTMMLKMERCKEWEVLIHPEPYHESRSTRFFTGLHFGWTTEQMRIFAKTCNDYNTKMRYRRKATIEDDAPTIDIETTEEIFNACN